MVNLNKHNKARKLISLLIITAMCLAGVFCVTGCKKEEPASEPETKQEEDSIYGDDSFAIDPAVDESLKDYRNILLLGIDNGNRSDVIMILSINKKTNEVKSATVLRDTYMQISPDGTYEVDGVEYEFYKCNRAYKRDGIYGAMIELNRHMDLNIRECIAMDWKCMANFIESMGGVEGYIDENMLVFINENVPTDDPDAHFRVDGPGQQHLNGWQTVQYMRARKYEGGTPQKRDARNQDVLQQLFDKAKGMSTKELEEIYDKLAYQIETNMSRNTLTDTLALISKSTLETQEGWPYEYTEMWQDDDSFYYFVCDTLDSNVKEFHKVMFGQENYETSETVKMLNEKLETARKEQLH